MDMPAAGAPAPTAPPAPAPVPPPRAPAARATGWWPFLASNGTLLVVVALAALLGGWVDTEVEPYKRRMVMLVGFNVILAVSLQLINGFSGQFSLGHAGFMAVGAYLAAYPAINLSQKLRDPAASLWFFVTLGVLVGVVGTALFLLFRGLRATRKFHRSLPVILLLMLLAWVLIDLANSEKAAPWLMWTKLFHSVSAAFEWLLDYGQPIASRVSEYLPEAIRQPICFVVLVVGGGCCAAVMGLIV